MDPFLYFIFGFLALYLALVAWDFYRIRVFAQIKGWTNIEISLSRFSPGWFSRGNLLYYRVNYFDPDNLKQTVFCTVSLRGQITWFPSGA